MRKCLLHSEEVDTAGIAVIEAPGKGAGAVPANTMRAETRPVA
jgi:hypothetical protein